MEADRQTDRQTDVHRVEPRADQCLRVAPRAAWLPVTDRQTDRHIERPYIRQHIHIDTQTQTRERNIIAHETCSCTFSASMLRSRQLVARLQIRVPNYTKINVHNMRTIKIHESTRASTAKNKQPIHRRIETTT